MRGITATDQSGFEADAVSVPRPQTEAQAAALYREREAVFAGLRDREAARSRDISNARLVTFLAGLALLLTGSFGRFGATGAMAAAGALALAGFAALVVWHARVEDRRARLAALTDVNRLGRIRLERDWHGLPPADPSTAGADHPYADDLDLFGHASLMQLLETGTTPGKAALTGWLLAPSPPAVIRERQQAVSALSPLVGFRQQLAANRRLEDQERPHDLERFLAWAEAPPTFVQRGWFVWGVRGLTASVWVGGAGHAWGFWTAAGWIVPVGVAALISLALARPVGAIFDRAFARSRVFGRYARLFALMRGLEIDAAMVTACRRRLCEGGAAAARMRQLDRLMAFADLRYAMALLHVVIQVLTLWDFHVAFALERWQRTAGPHVRTWMAALGEVDALAALATLAHDHPAWVFPTVDTSGPAVVRARGLAHPLLAGTVRVANDVEIGPPGTFLLVTGSNMSGKSTLLRAIGLNVVLAQAGGPVCAETMRTPPTQVETAMRVQDSLELGLSYFMAGLARLKTIVAAARETRGTDRPVLFLLDEVLQGTNSAERLIAVRRIIARLVGDGAVGAVTTHDLALADAPDIAAIASRVHFAETVDEGPDGLRMSFDYHLRPGLATSRNALLLMRMMGLEDESRQL